jgi:transcriptional regulator with XRE-family HTH domain
MTEQELKKTLGENIKVRRDYRGWNQEELSVKAGVTKNTISDIETGQKFARAKTLVRLAKALDTQVYELMKPKNVPPDNAADAIALFSGEVREAVEKVGKSYLKKERH